MNVGGTPQAVRELAIIQAGREKQWGYVLGSRFGHSLIIEHFMVQPGPLKSLYGRYPSLFQSLKDELLGVFFANQSIQGDPWVAEDYIFRIDPGDIALFSYDPEKKKLQKISAAMSLKEESCKTSSPETKR